MIKMLRNGFRVHCFAKAFLDYQIYVIVFVHKSINEHSIEYLNLGTTKICATCGKSVQLLNFFQTFRSFRI